MKGQFVRVTFAQPLDLGERFILPAKKEEELSAGEEI